MNISDLKTLERIISSTNLSRTPHSNQAIDLSKDKVRPSYYFKVSYSDINPNLTKIKHSFNLNNGICCSWQPEPRFTFLCFDQDLGVKRRGETLFITNGHPLLRRLTSLFIK